MDNKFHMTREQSVFYVKRNIIDYIWKSAKLEGLAVTYPDTEAIFNGLSIQGVSVNDIVAVNNLKHAWQFLLDTLEYQSNYAFICKLNQHIGEGHLIYGAGQLRTLPVRIGGTNWVPPVPDEILVKDKLQEILAISNDTERAIELMLFLMRGQLFLDGNKRTAMLAANHVMVASGTGIISVPIEKQKEFTEMLVSYYETGEAENLKAFVYEHCIDGLAFEKKG